MIWRINEKTCAIYHHGIKGQHWGKRNGPPYPLNRATHDKVLNRAKTTTPKIDHHAHDKDTTKQELVSLALSVVMLNPIGVGYESYRLANAAISNARTKKIEKRIANAREKDKKTGFALKDREYTPEQDMKQVNPGFKNFNTNTKSNCMLCTMTYEMRRRGYDVTANTASRGYMTESTQEWFPKSKINTIKGSKMPGEVTTSDTYRLNKELTKNTITQLSKEPVGSRGNLCIKWTKGGGHSVVYEVTDKGPIIRDCQTGKTIKDIGKYINKSRKVEYIRLDNVDFDPKKIKECCR